MAKRRELIAAIGNRFKGKRHAILAFARAGVAISQHKRSGRRMSIVSGPQFTVFRDQME